MSFNDEFWKELNKKKKQKESSTTRQTSSKKSTTSNGAKTFTDKFMDAMGDDIAPMPSITLSTMDRGDIAPVGGKKDSWFKSGGFSDGVDGVGDFFGDLGETALGTAADLGIGVVKGAGRMVEGLVDLGTYGVAKAADALGEDEFAEKARKTARYSATDEWTKGATDFVDQYSILGNKADMVSEGLGQVAAVILTGGAAGAAGLGGAGVAAVTTGVTGLSAMGTNMGAAYDSGATDKDAFLYGLSTGAIEAGTELLFGGLGKGVKALGISRGIGGLDDIFAKKLAGKIAGSLTNESVQKALGNTIEYAVKSSGEGVEEVLSGLGSAVMKKLTYEDDESLLKLIEDENLLEQFVVGAVTSSIAQGGDFIKATKSGTDLVTGQTAADEKVVSKVVEDEIARREAAGETLTDREKNKIYDSVVERMEHGQIDIDTIEEVLGGESYKAYTDHVDTQEKLKAELETLSNIKASDMTRNQQKRLEELEGMNLDDTAKRDGLRKTLDDTLSPMLQNSKLTESYRERERRGHAFEADLSKYTGKKREAVERAVKSGVLNNTYRSHELVDVLSKIEAEKGIVFDYTNNAKLKDSGFAVEGKTVNGFANKNKGTVTLNVQSSKAWQSVVGHEITHVLEGTEAYGELRNALYAYAESKGELEGRRASLTALYQNMDADIDAELTADLVGDYLFTDKEFVNNLTGNRTLFQKIYDEIKYLWNVATGKEKTEIEKVKGEFDRVWKEFSVKGADAKADDGKNQYSLTAVDAVQPKSDKWARTHTTEEAMAVFPDMWNVSAEESEVRNPTQITSTVNTYRKIYNILQNEGFDGKILDASSGLGYGTRAGVEEYGFDVEDIEPYPDANYSPKYQDYSTLDEKYDVIISNAVLNVLPQDQRDALAVKMGELLNDGGRLFVNVRGKDVETLAKTGKNIHLGNMEWIETVKGSYQKGFTKPELVAYLQDALGDGFTVEPTNMFGGVAAVVTKESGKVQYSLGEDVKVLEGGTAVKYSLSTWTPETKDKVRKNLVKAGYETERVDKWIDDLNGVASVIAADKDRLDFEAADNQVMLKNNQEYVKTLDASTLCAKRLQYQGTFNAIQHRLPNTVLTSDDLIELQNMLKEHGYEAPCSVCYVESRRRHLGKFAQEWLDGYGGEYKPNLDEVTTSDGLEKLRHSHPDTYKSFVDAMNAKGSANPKVVQLRTEYRNDIMSLTKKQVEKIEAIGGLRIQSFSDFETPHLLDMMQAVMDMSAKGLTSQAYTKVPNFAWVFGDTGIKINLSLIAEGNGFDSDGNLAFSSVEGMDINDAMAVRDAYSENVGTIIVGANDAHILACMADDRIDYIIPFHRSGWGKNEMDMMGLGSYEDYSSGQNEHDLATGKKVANLYPPDYWDYNVSGKENAERYLKLCAQTGREPKFSNFLVNNGDGSYSLQPDGSTDGYWKTLIDFKMYDNEGNGVKQQKVQPNFNMEEAYRVLNEYEGGANSLPVANDVVEEFVAKHSDDIAPTPDVQYSISDSEGNELSLAVQKRFDNSKAVDENGNLKVLYHGTYGGEFYTFDKSKGNVEGDFGSGFYFTDSEYDVESNYEDGGPDFENKVARRAEQIEAEEEIDYHEAEARAREELYKGGNKFEVYLNIEKPAVVGETILFDPDKYYEEYDREDYDSYEDYEGDVEQLVADDIDQIIWDVENNVDVYSTDGLAEVLWNAVNEGGIGVEELKAQINDLYLEDSAGNLVGNEVTRQVIESLGYDGIIDPTVSHKWNMDMEEGTTHYIVFKPNQIKDISNQNPTDDPDIRRSLSNESEEYAPVGDYSTPFRELALEDIAPVGENVAPTQETVSEAPSLADIPVLPDEELEDGTYAAIRPEKKKPVATKSERIADGSRSDELLYDSLDNHPVQTLEQKIAEKIRALHGEIADRKDLRREKWDDYESRIADLRAKYNSKKNKNTKEASKILQSISRLERMKASDDADFSKRISDLEARIQKMSDPKYGTAMQKRAKMEADAKWAADLLGDTSTWVDKKIGLQYATNTERRNLRDIVRDENGNVDIAKADAIDDALNGQYNRDEAAKKRELADVRDKYAKLKITKAEDAYIQMLGELRHNPDTSLTELDVTEYYEKHSDKIDTAKVDKIIEMARQDYDSWLNRVNAELKKQGMREIPYRQGYFPHFTEPKQNFIQKLLNWKTQDNEIPTSIAGLTETFKPTRSWQSFDKRRYSDETDYSFMKGFDSYSEGALDWIYHMDTLQKRRAVENHIRYTHSDEGISDRIKAVYANEEMDANEAQAQIEHILSEAKNPLNNFVQDFTTHTNILAGKKNSLDRTVEQWTNRHIYSVMTNVQNRMSANMVLANVRSALTNFIPITQSWAQVSPLRSIQAAKQTIANSIKDDGTVDKSTFLTNRLREVDKLYQTGWDKVLDKAGIMFEIVDNFTSQVIWRSKYNQNIADGMSEAAAIKNADQFAENVMAGRSKGNEPTLFNAKNPFVKAFTMFQLEVNNQYGYLFKDVPNDLKAETEHWKFNLVKGYTTAFIGAYVYNALLEKVTGGDAALDPIGIVEELLRDLGLFGDDEEEEPIDTAMNLAGNIAEELPFIGGVLGGGRVPISSAIPYGGEYGGGLRGFAEDVGNIGDGGLKNIGKEMMNPILNVGLPVAGGQLKKTYQGLNMFSDNHPVSGSYTDSGKLRFPVEDTPLNRVQAAVFGQYASKNAREYFDNGYAPLGEKQIQEYIDVDMPIKDYWEYREGLNDLAPLPGKSSVTLEQKLDYVDGLDLPTRKKNILVNNLSSRKDPIDMTSYGDYDSLEEFDFATDKPEKYAFAKSVGGYSAYQTYSDALYDIKADKDASGKTINGSRKEKVLDYINNLDADYYTKILLYKSEYTSDDTYNQEIVEYINNRSDLSYTDRVNILTELGFRVTADGQIYAD